MVGLAVVLVALLIAPAPSTAVDSDLTLAYPFKVEASNGYEIVAFAANDQAGRGHLVLHVFRGMDRWFSGNAVSYVAPALLTETSLTADLGPLGKVDLDVSPTGREHQVGSGCGKAGEGFTYEPPRFSGNFEFHGEEGYTEAVSTAPTEYARFFDLLVCGPRGGRSEIREPHLPGARLRLRAGNRKSRLMLLANKNRPGKRSHLEVQTHEKRGNVWISRSAAIWAGSGAFQFDPKLDAATVAPPVPFSGRARFSRAAAPADRWTGNLTVDLPGRSDVPLTGTGGRATLVPACWQGEGVGPGC